MSFTILPPTRRELNKRLGSPLVQSEICGWSNNACMPYSGYTVVSNNIAPVLTYFLTNFDHEVVDHYAKN